MGERFCVSLKINLKRNQESSESQSSLRQATSLIAERNFYDEEARVIYIISPFRDDDNDGPAQVLLTD